MALTCSLPGLDSVLPGSLNNLSSKAKQALLVMYLYQQKNPSTANTPVPADVLLSQASCIACASESMLQSFAVWIQRQAAIDAGAAINSFVASTERGNANALVNLSFQQLRAIEIMLRCQLS